MNKVLEKSVELMLSSDYKERFLAEYMQLKNRYEGLCNMVIKWDGGQLAFTPTCSREVYDIQLRAMKEYLDVLVIRAKIENIELC